MREAVIVSTARTPIGKAYRGAFNNTEAPTLGGHAIREAVKRAARPGEIEDVIMGAALQQGTQGFNVARQSPFAAGLPVTTAGMTRGPPVLLGPDGDRDRGQDRSCATASTSWSAAASSRSAWCRTSIEPLSRAAIRSSIEEQARRCTCR